MMEILGAVLVLLFVLAISFGGGFIVFLIMDLVYYRDLDK